MTLFIAFLRGVNVGGRNLVSMKEICHKLTTLGLESVSSYRTSGNILFEVDMEQDTITDRIQKTLCEFIGKEVKVFLRTSTQIQEIVDLDPFSETKLDPVKFFITFTPYECPGDIRVPLKSPNLDVEVILVRDSEIFSRAYLRKGRYGAPNKFIETEFKIPATTRNWNTIIGLKDIIDRDYGSK